MKLTIGENIKALRREKDITQEEFATILGVTYQSVSRWENSVCYPDMELLPSIADFFGITVDKLIGADKAVEQKEVDEYLLRFQKAINKGLIYDCIEIAREGVAAYPNNYALLNKLMCALFISGDDDGNIPEWQENMQKYDAEITALGERIMNYCPDQNIRLEATARLAFQHCETGRKEIGRKIYETLPSAEYCKENCIYWGVLEKDEVEGFVRNKNQTDYHNLRSSVWLLATCGCIPDKDAITVLKKVFELEELISDGNVIKNGWGHARLNFELACFYANTGDKENSLRHLRLCVEAAKAFDKRPDEQSYQSIILGTVTEKRLDFETSDNRPLSEIVRESWLNDNDLDTVRNCAEFNEIRSMF